MSERKNMSDPKERRFFERISIPGAEVSYRKSKRFNWFNGFTGPVPMKDITKGGICFKIQTPLAEGMTIEIKVVIPGEAPFDVKGNIVWANQFQASDEPYAGVQFRPFGKGRHYNSFRTHERLENITRQFAKT